MQNISLFAGIISTSIFTASHIPMLIRAFRTKDLHSYSAANLVLANLGNVFHWLYVAGLPFGPIWFLHCFYTLVSAVMLFWYLHYRRTASSDIRPSNKIAPEAVLQAHKE